MKENLALCLVILSVCLGFGGCNYLVDCGHARRIEAETKASLIKSKDSK